MKLGINVVRLTRQFTGVGRYLECMLRHWAGHGVPFDEVILYAPQPIRADLVEFPLEAFTVRLVGQPAPDPLWEWRSLRRAAQEVDVLFCPSYTVPVGYPGRCAVSYLGPAYNEGISFEAMRASLYDRLYRYSALRADHVFTCSQVVRDGVLERYGVPSDRVSVTYFAASDFFTPAPKGAGRDATVGRYVGSALPYFLYVGKLSGRHYIPELLEGFASAARKGSFPHHLVLAGPDAVGYDIPAYARRLGLQDRIHWIPFVPHRDLPALYSAADAFVFPVCDAEGFGIPVIEAMACGVPVISVAQGSVPEFAGGSALLVPRPERTLLSEAIETLAHDDALRAKLREAGLKTAAQYSWGLTADQTMDVLWNITQR